MSLTNSSEIKKHRYEDLIAIIDELEEEPRSYEFREPVKWKGNFS